MIEIPFDRLRTLGLTPALANLATAQAAVDTTDDGNLGLTLMRLVQVHRETLLVHDGVGERGARVLPRLTRALIEEETALAVGDPDADDLRGALAALGVAWIDVTARSGGEAVGSVRPTGDTAAFLQYTSGSTSSPKGVIVSHGNLAANLAMLESGFGVRGGDKYLTWLPLFHDAGLVANLLAALYCGVPCILMQPLSFFQRPQRCA